ncbi:MAG: chitobiase/beta-hexosaminidase C-terminal domain-containing protein, partial [Clostridia bacterium]|nr:chitobiase/beta-hexosaminidase C-terminal domain-containing protein [Clostridia bacterium]
AIEKLEVALEREPKNVDALLYMAQAYMKVDREDEAVEIYESLINEIAPQHPSAYRSLINIYQERGYYSEALSLMKTASENTLESTQEFDIMIRAYTPTAPAFSHPEGRYNEEIDVTITIPKDEIVYYTTDGTDPSESGLIYTEGTKIHLSEGKLTVKAIGFTENGMPSEQIVANYTVIIPTPAAPKANYKSGVYKNAPKVSLRPGDEDPKKNRDIVAIYYTLDGRQATTSSTLYNDDEPIQIPVGDSTLRAISVDKNGKVSYEMKVTYKVEGNLKRMFTDENDTFKNLTLYKTTYNTFVKAWGTPLSYEVLPEDRWYDEGMETYEAEYEWGLAWFTIKPNTKDPVLVMLDTANTKMTAPRTTKVSMSAAQVMEKFRDLGHPALDEYGNRLLYNWNSANVQFGTYRYEGDGQYAIHYYDPVDEKQTIFVELSYYLDEDGGNVERIVWRRYLVTRR